MRVSDRSSEFSECAASRGAVLGPPARARHDGQVPADGTNQRADSEEVTVSAVANRWGFTHLGRFAGIYRAMYGAPPSQTLRDAT
jgi:hypothetical protein